MECFVLCSGGLDSVVTSYWVRRKFSSTKITLIFINYGQNSVLSERISSKRCAKSINASFVEIKLPIFKKSRLINGKKQNKIIKGIANTSKEGEQWYVPARNTLFISHALSFIESYSKSKENNLFLGFKSEGNEPYLDTTLNYVSEWNKLAKQAINKKVKISAPFIKMDKEDIILLALKLKVPLKKTFSCYQSGTNHCGICLACKLRKAGFYWAGIKDPTSYTTA